MLPARHPEVPQLARVSGEAARQSVCVLGRKENVNWLLSQARAQVRLPRVTELRRGAGRVGSRHPGAWTPPELSGNTLDPKFTVPSGCGCIPIS